MAANPAAKSAPAPLHHGVVTGSDDGTAKIWETGEHHYHLRATLHHSASITSVDVSNRGDVLTASRDGTVKIWSSSGRLKATFHNGNSVEHSHHESHNEHHHTDFVSQATWCKSGRFDSVQFATASDDCKAGVWDAAAGTCQLLSDPDLGHFQPLTSVAYDTPGEKIITSSFDASAIIWSGKARAVWRAYPGSQGRNRHEQAVWSAKMNFGRDRLLTASRDTTAKLWDVATSVCKHTFKSHDDICLEANFGGSDLDDGGRMSECDYFVLTCGMDNKAFVYDTRRGNQEIAKMNDHRGAVWSVVMSSRDGGRKVLTCGHDTSAFIYDVSMLTDGYAHLRHELTSHTGILWHASFSPDERLVLTCSDDHTAKVWPTASSYKKLPSMTLQDPAAGGATHLWSVTCAAWFPPMAMAAKALPTVADV